MKRKLLLELNEMRKMMGLPLLIEQVTPTTKKVLNLVGYTDSSIDNLAKQVDLSDLSKISDEFASMGIKTMEDWQTLASKQGIDLKTATDDQILKLIDSTPNLKSSILKSYNDKVVKLTNELIANTDVKTFLPINMQTEITTVMSKELTDENSDIIIKLVDSQLEKLDKLFDNLQKSKVEIPEPLQKLYDNLTTKKEDALNFKTKKSNNVSQNISKNVSSEADPQAYLKNLSYDQLATKLDYNTGWVSNGISPKIMSGWKFHVFGEDLVDSVFLKEKLWPVTQKWNAGAKVGGIKHTDGVTYPSMQPGGVQYGKQGATIYIPVDVINSGKQQEMLSDIQNAIAGYKKGGNISGDQAITPSIHYRYELLGPVPKEGIDMKTYDVMYNKNSGGPYKPDDVEDLFTKKSGGDQGSNIAKPQNLVSTGFLGSKFGDTSDINWGSITNAKDIKSYDDLIDKAMKSGNFNSISRGGFEAYGIPNFREYLMNIYNKEKGVTSNSQTPININRPKEGPSNWSDYQYPNRGNNPYYGSGSN